MKRLVILLFLFLGGVCVFYDTGDVYAAGMNGKSSIYFDSTYVYTPDEEIVNGITPTGNPPKLIGNTQLPQTNEVSSNQNFVMLGILLCIVSFYLNNYWKKELNYENS